MNGIRVARIATKSKNATAYLIGRKIYQSVPSQSVPRASCKPNIGAPATDTFSSLGERANGYLSLNLLIIGNIQIRTLF